jgi:hypothetical protein
MNIHPIPPGWIADAKVEPVEGMSGAGGQGVAAACPGAPECKKSPTLRT